MTIEQKLHEMGIVLPKPSAPAANYLPFVRHGDLLFISGQVPFENGAVAVKGKLGAGVSLDEGRRAARICAINVLAQISAGLDGDLERVVRFLRVTGFVASAPDFTDQPQVINGASDFFVEVLGDRGRHSRAAVGMAALPMDAAVEVDAIVAVK